MATYKSNIMEKQTGSMTAKLRPVEIGGRVRIAHGSFIPAAACEAGSIIELVRLPQGARLLPASRLHFEAGQSASLTISCGDSTGNVRYLSAKAPGASETTVMLDGNRLGDFILPHEDVIRLETGGAALAAGKKIAFDLFYVTD